MATPLPSRRKRKKLSQEEEERERAGHLHSYYSPLRGWGDGHLHSSFSSLGDGEMATPLPGLRKTRNRRKRLKKREKKNGKH